MNGQLTDTRYMRCYRGVLTDEGIECQAFRSDEGELFTLIGDLGGYSVGDRVVVCGTIAEISICMQGVTLVLSFIGRNLPRAGASAATKAAAARRSTASKKSGGKKSARKASKSRQSR